MLYIPSTKCVEFHAGLFMQLLTPCVCASALCVSQLDVGDPEKILLMSRDQQTMIIVS